MVGIITHSQEHGSEDFGRHIIKWAKPEHNVDSQGWRLGEFELIEDVDKNCPTK
jgi:hypothetical protein